MIVPRNAMLNAALDYAKQGLKVFPALIIRGKGGKWQKLGHFKGKDTNNQRWGATSDLDTIIEYWRKRPEARIGIPTGSTNGFFAIDVDTPEGHDKDGFASLHKLEAAYGPLPKTLNARSVTGSIHYYYTMPTGVIIKSGASELLVDGEPLAGIDIKGEGGMVIAPPSTHPRGGQYVWINDLKIADAPPWLIELTRKPDIVVRQKKSCVAWLHVPKNACVGDPELAAMVEADRGRGVSTYPNDKIFYASDADPRSKIKAALEYIPAEVGYYTWFYIGCAIYNTLGPSGFDLFDNWSRQSLAKYNAELCREKYYEHIPINRSGKKRLAGTIYDIADQFEPNWRLVYEADCIDPNWRKTLLGAAS
jgi:hypothetical protein